MCIRDSLYSIIFLTAAGHFRDIKAILRAFVREDRLFRHQLKFRMLKQKRGDLLVVVLAVERAGAVEMCIRDSSQSWSVLAVSSFIAPLGSGCDNVGSARIV